MNLEEYKSIKNLKVNEEKMKDLYLRDIALGNIEGKITGYPSKDKPWLKFYSEEVILDDVPKKTAYRYIYDRNKDYLDRNAFDYYGNKITYGEFFKRIDVIASALLNYGIKEGDIVSVAMPSLPETIALFYAISKIGAVANMIDPRVSGEGIKEYVQETNSKLLFIVDVAESKVDEFKNDKIVDDIISVSPSISLPAPLKFAFKLKEIGKSKKTNSDNWDAFIKRYSSNDKNIEYEKSYEEDMPLVIVHTGGTTGKSKGVVLTHDNLNCASYQCEIAGYDFKREHNWLNIMPPFIAYGIGNGLHLPLACGMEVIIIPAFDPNKFDKLLLKYRPNHMVGVPSHYGNLMKSKKLDKQDMSYVIAPVVGGDKMDEELEKATNEYLARHNCEYKIVKGYGLTEVNAAVAACTSNENNELGSVGIPFPKTNISIFEPNTENELKYGEMGEVCITGPNTMKEYYNNEEETNNIIRVHSDGTKWVHSGDVGYMTENGNLFIVDRIKRIIIRPDGFKIYPSMIEDVIMQDKNVKLCKVVGVRDYKFSQGKLPKAHITLEDYNINETEQIERLKELCANKLPEYCQPNSIEINESLPLTPIGKIDYRKLEQVDESKLKLEKFLSKK